MFVGDSWVDCNTAEGELTRNTSKLTLLMDPENGRKLSGRTEGAKRLVGFFP